jgi:hypothetical protein
MGSERVGLIGKGSKSVAWCSLARIQRIKHIVREKVLPSTVDMSMARARAIELWRATDKTAAPPLTAVDSSSFAEKSVVWPPVLNSFAPGEI